MTITATYGTLSASEHSTQLRKAVIASTIGTAIEWYDFFLYGTAAGLIFGKLFFPNSDPLTATLAAFGTYFIGFVGRPIGAAIFGHYGDRIGRKATLIATLLCMGIATFLIAFVPTYETIGIWGAVKQERPDRNGRYFFQQLTGDSGLGAKLGDFKGRVAGIGPHIGFLFRLAKRIRAT